MMLNLVKKSALVGLMAMTMLASACGDDSSDNSNPTENSANTEFFEVTYERSIEEDALDSEAARALKSANTASAFRFYRELRGQEPNLIFSPFSFSRAFAGYYSPDAATAPAFQALFGFEDAFATLGGWGALTQQVSDRSYSSVPEESQSSFTAADIYWVDVRASGSADRSYFDRVHTLELQADPEGSRERINEWVADESHGMLVDFLPEGVINPLTEAVATNVVFFVGAWTHDYDAEMVDFQGASGTSSVSGFKGIQEMSAFSDDTVTVVEIPYESDYHHLVIMPHADFDAYANAMDEEVLGDLRSSLFPYEVTLTMPEFSADSAPDMVKAIEDLREETGTNVGGTLTGAFMETYVHKAAIEVTREGTRAAAATAVVEYANSEPEPLEPLTVTIDKPFIHMIMDARSGSVLFLGEYTGPQ